MIYTLIENKFDHEGYIDGIFTCCGTLSTIFYHVNINRCLIKQKGENYTETELYDVLHALKPGEVWQSDFYWITIVKIR